MATNAAKRAVAAKKKAKKPSRQSGAETIIFGAAEDKAFDLVQQSPQVRKELEVVVTAAIADAVRQVFKEQRIDLTAREARNVSLVLFGD